MPDLDRLETYRNDPSKLGQALSQLPASFPRPQETYAAPFGVVGFGEGWWPAELLSQRIPATLAQGTTFVLAGGFGLGRLQGLIAAAREASDRVVIAGPGEAAEVKIDFHPLSPYRYLRFVLEASGESALGAEIDAALEAERERAEPNVATTENPAKLLAWTLLERTPIWVVSERYPMLAPALQQLFARIGKSLSIAPPPSALEFFISALEARHEQGDPLLAVVIGEDEATDLALEVLETRVAGIERLTPPKAQGAIPEAVAYWYRMAWVSYYLALLYGTDPGDHEVMTRLREAAQ